MPIELSPTLQKIFKVISKNEKLNFLDGDEVKIGKQVGELLRVSTGELESPFPKLEQTLRTKTSPLPDLEPDLELLNQLIGELTKQNAVIRLNHVGFCYHVDSQTKEKSRLLSINLPKGISLYEEPSNDNAKWYFIGDTNNWQEPLVEFLPVESNGDTFIDYWLPHVHIDIDTTLDENQIESLLYRVYDGDPKPFRSTVIDGVVYTIRLRLGIVSGVNLFLDISTNHRRVEFHRKNILKTLK